MNIETTGIKHSTDSKTGTKNNNSSDNNIKFADELNEIKKAEEAAKSSLSKDEENIAKKTETDEQSPKDSEDTLNNALNGLKSIVKEFNQSEDNLTGSLKNNELSADKQGVINNDFNIQDNKEILPQMNPNMNFSGNGQPFSSFMENDSKQNKNPNKILGMSAQDLAEEAAILSTMSENIAIANRNQILKDTRTITNEDGIKKVDSNTGIKIENIVKFDSIVMNQADVEVFVNLVENKEVNLNNLAPKAAEKTVQVSKTLANLLAKSMENNQPIRIDFDNNISVIIKISREGKITADFLPSSQVAEVYLKENLPLLKQRFDENNIEYDSLNQRERRNNNKDNNRKKENSNE